MARKKTIAGKEELRLNKPRKITKCPKCGFHFPGEGIFTCFCKTAHQCSLAEGVLVAIPMAVKEELNRI